MVKELNGQESPFRQVDKTAEFIYNLIISDPALKKAEDYASEHHIPILMPDSAAFLRQITMLHRPKRVLEVGMGIGYSGTIMLNSGAEQLDTIECNEQSIEFGLSFFKQNNLFDRVNIFRGDESEIIPYLKNKYDMIFLDGAKSRYPHHLPYLKGALKSGGVLLADNVLFAGMVAGGVPAKKKQSIVDSLRLFLHTLCSDNDFSTSILRVGDGMSLSIKKT